MDPLSLLLPRATGPSHSLSAAAAAAPLNSRRLFVLRRRYRGARLSVSSVAAETPRTEEARSPSPSGEGRFDWLDQWYAFAPVCDLDSGAPHGKMVFGHNVVAWYDRGAGEWRVFDDACPHRLAPLSEGRIDDKGRLQCAYHGWCFDGAGACKFIPQAPALGPSVRSQPLMPIHEVIPSHPPYFPPQSQNTHNFFLSILACRRCTRTARRAWRRTRAWCRTSSSGSTRESTQSTRTCYRGSGRRSSLRLIIPSSSLCTASGISSAVEYDKEGGGPTKMKIETASIEGFLSAAERGYFQFEAPCTLQGSAFCQEMPPVLLVFFCVPVAPGRSRVIWAFPTNVRVWLNKIVPRWFYHINQNLILDSDLYLLHVQERTFAAVGLDNWQKACYVPTSSDGMVIAFRSWFRKFCKNQVGWATPQVDQLMDRYWSHVVQCTSCSAALKAMKALEVALQVASVAVVGFLTVAKGTLLTSTVQRATVVSVAVLCFAACRWLGNFMERNFYFQDYVHAYK